MTGVKFFRDTDLDRLEKEIADFLGKRRAEPISISIGAYMPSAGWPVALAYRVVAL